MKVEASLGDIAELVSKTTKNGYWNVYIQSSFSGVLENPMKPHFLRKMLI